MNYLNFETREEYLELKQAWGKSYAKSVQDIRDTKQLVKQMHRDGTYNQRAALTAAYWKARAELGGLATLRLGMKTKAQEQYLARVELYRRRGQGVRNEPVQVR